MGPCASSIFFQDLLAFKQIVNFRLTTRNRFQDDGKNHSWLVLNPHLVAHLLVI